MSTIGQLCCRLFEATDDPETLIVLGSIIRRIEDLQIEESELDLILCEHDPYCLEQIQNWLYWQIPWLPTYRQSKFWILYEDFNHLLLLW